MICAAVVGGLASLTRTLTRGALALRRQSWINELAKTEGLDAKALADSFTLDSR